MICWRRTTMPGITSGATIPTYPCASTRAKLLYWPIAIEDTHAYQSCLEWITATFAPLKITYITMWTDLREHRAIDLDGFDGVYIGGGNTFSLLSQLVESGFDRHLTDYVRKGGAVYGGSAGAAVLGLDIGTIRHLDRNDIDLVQTRGLDLVHGHSVWVHYRSQDDARIRDYVKQQRHPVLAISERSGIIIESTGMRAVGYELVYRFDERGKTTVSGSG